MLTLFIYVQTYTYIFIYLLYVYKTDFDRTNNLFAHSYRFLNHRRSVKPLLDAISLFASLISHLYHDDDVRDQYIEIFLPSSAQLSPDSYLNAERNVPKRFQHMS